MQFGTAFQDEIHHPFVLAGDHSCAAILIHGFPGTPNEMRPLAHVFHEAGLTVHVPLLPGFGPQLDSLPDRRYEDWYTALHDVYRTALKQHQRVVLAGYSMGGALATVLASEMPPAGLVLCAPFWKFDALLWQVLPVLKWVFPRFKPFRLFKPDFSDPEFRASILKFTPGADLDDPQVRTSILNFEIPVHMIDSIRLAGQRAYHAASQVDCPVLLLQGRMDELVQPALTRQFAAQFLRSPRFIEVSATHALLNPDQAGWTDVVAAVRSFTYQFTSEG